MKSVLRVVKYLLIITVFVVAIGFFLAKMRVPYNDIMVIEAGDELFSAAYFFKSPQGDAAYVTDVDKLDIRHVGDYPITISLNGLRYHVKLRVKDSVAPVVRPQEHIESCYGNIISPKEFVESVDDVTDCVYEYVISPDFFKLGNQRVRVLVRDEGGNEVVFESEVEIIEDKSAPVLYGLHDIYVHLGDPIMYSDEIIIHDEQAGATYDIDKSEVIDNKVGDYPVYYKTRDVSGNEKTYSVTLHVLEPVVSQMSDDEILEVFRVEYEKIVTPDMTKKEKAKAIFDHLSGTLEYIPVTDKASYIKNAYTGLTTKKGDCVTYYSMYRIWLNMAGIENMKVVTKNESHTFNMINCGDGWYFVDTFYGDNDLFMMTKEDLKKYMSRGYEFLIDEDNYPDTD